MNIIIVVLLAILLFSIIFLFSINPNYQVKRSKVFRVPRDRLFEQVFDFHKFVRWNPWLIHDTNATLRFSDRADQKGSWYSWDGKVIGAGSITHQDFAFGEYIKQQLVFTRPYKAQCQLCWDFTQEQQADEQSVQLTWIMHGKMPRPLAYMAKRMDAIIGKDFELGLDLLASKLHGQNEAFTLQLDDTQTFQGGRYVLQAYSGTLASLAQVLPSMYTSLHHNIGDQVDTAFPAIAVYQKYRNKPEPSVDMLAGIPVQSHFQLTQKSIDAGWQLQNIHLGNKYSVTRLTGDYRYLRHAWHVAMGHVRMHKIKLATTGDMYEVYCSMRNDAPHTNNTEILIPIR